MFNLFLIIAAIKFLISSAGIVVVLPDITGLLAGKYTGNAEDMPCAAKKATDNKYAFCFDYDHKNIALLACSAYFPEENPKNRSS